MIKYIDRVILILCKLNLKKLINMKDPLTGAGLFYLFQGFV